MAVYCGNYWECSNAGVILEPFVSTLNTDRVRRLVSVIATNERAKSELFQAKTKARAIQLLHVLKAKLTINSHLVEVDQVIATV
ncbi:MAG TPA: hypothetical protein VFE41_28155 [Acetobacteraceae bacterium]|nr:hypothetical protein [Acetobacteraceae bacterium]